MFSGVKPTPSAEEEYDAWAEQTAHLLEEWQCSDNIKKQDSRKPDRSSC